MPKNQNIAYLGHLKYPGIPFASEAPLILREEVKMATSNYRLPNLAALFLALMIVSYGCEKKNSPNPSRAPQQNAPGPAANLAAPNAGPDNPESDEVARNSNNNVEVNSPSEPNRSAHSEPMAIPGGRTLRVRLLESISSRTANPGQHFDAELSAPVVVNGRTVLPSRTPLRGRVVAARSSGRLHKPGYLRLTLDSVRTPDGRWVPIRTTSVWAQGKSHKKRNLTLIGGGTGLGAVIGAIAGGGKGAAIGAAAGAGAGTAGAYATGKKDVTFPAEHKLSFATTQRISVG